MKKFIATLLILNFAAANCFSAVIWKNDARKMFQQNKLKFMEINIRTFNAKDLNENGIIDFELGETSGNFKNAIERLDELKALGINAIHVMPITPVGSHRALGTAGSLYALSEFSEINPQLISSKNADAFREFENFVYECHLRNIRVIVDLPSCGSYDLFLKHPELFYINDEEEPVSPADWLDVYLFKVYNDDGTLNEKLFEEHKNFIDMIIRAKVDGIRADVAPLKPFEFWKKLINYARAYNSEFLFLAEASNSWNEKHCKECVFTPYNKLFEAGFDGYYGSYFNFKDWEKAEQFKKQVKFDIETATKYKDRKSAIASFTTHDEQSPTLIGGYNYATQIIWLNSVLPLNSYLVDGIQSGDNYLYPYTNQKAEKTYTDNLYYYAHNGKMDIFNFSRKPEGDFPQLKKEIMLSNGFKSYAQDLISFGSFNMLKTNNSEIFSFVRKNNGKTVFVALNKNRASKNKATIKFNDFKKNNFTLIRAHSPFEIKSNKIEVNLDPSEIIILYSER